GVPCATLLGGASDAVPVTAMVSFGSPARMADDAVALSERFGISAFKVKVGRDAALDVAAVTAIRDALPEATLYVDANRGWTPAQGGAAGGGLIEVGVTAIEEPLDLADASGRRELARRWTVPLGGDESCLTPADVARELGTVGQVSIKVARSAFRDALRV